MPTSADDSVRILIGDREHHDWTSYRIDSNLLIPADAWDVEVFHAVDEPLPDVIQAGARMEIRVGDDRVLTGVIDDVDIIVAKRQHTIRLTGRDLAANLVDLSSPLLDEQDITLTEVIDKIVKPLGIDQIDYRGGERERLHKVHVEPGETAWDVLQRACEQNGVWPWFDPDGTLVIGGPDYSIPPVGKLRLRRDTPADNNVLSLSVRWSVAGRFSELTILGQHGQQSEKGEPAKTKIKVVIRDDDMTKRGLTRPKIVTDGNLETLEQAQLKARKILADSRLEGLQIQATVRGHRTPNGVVWRPGQRVELDSEQHGLQGTYFLLARALVRDRMGGTVTELELHEDETWVLDASAIAEDERDIAAQNAKKTETEAKKASRRTARKSAQKAPKKSFLEIVSEAE